MINQFYQTYKNYKETTNEIQKHQNFGSAIQDFRIKTRQQLSANPIVHIFLEVTDMLSFMLTKISALISEFKEAMVARGSTFQSLLYLSDIVQNNANV